MIPEYILEFVQNTGLSTLIGVIIVWLFYMWYRSLQSVSQKSANSAVNNQKQLSDSAISTGEQAVNAAIETQNKLINAMLEKLLNNNDSNRKLWEEDFNDIKKSMSEISDNVSDLKACVDDISLRVTALEEAKSDEQNRHNNCMSRRLQVYDKILSLLKDMTSISGGSRSFIYEFHNGTNNITGMPFMKFSMQYEYIVPNEGMLPVISSFQNIPYSSITPLINHLFQYKYKYCSDTTQDEDKAVLMSYVRSRGAYATLYAPLFAIDNQTILGILGIDFKTDKLEGCDYQYFEQKFSNDIASIATLLDASNI